MLVLVAVMLIFIWGNSLLPADLSSAESGWMVELLEPVLRFIGSGRIQAIMTRAADRLPAGESRALAYRAIRWLDVHVLSRDPAFLVRKAAHFSEFALLGALMCMLLARPDGRGRFWWPEIICLCVAAIDETIQLMSDGRAAQLRDVVLDLSGATAGVLCACILLAVLGAVQKRKIGRNMS